MLGRPTIEHLRRTDERQISLSLVKWQGQVYIVATTDITGLCEMQARFDEQAGYTGEAGTYESMLFTQTGESLLYPFGDLPGHEGLGVFQRYATEEQARDGHQVFLTQVQQTLMQLYPAEESGREE